jgi:serine protease DegQ
MLAVFGLTDGAARARAPLLDESRGVLTLAHRLTRVTPAVVTIAVVTRVAEENSLLKDRYFRKFFGLPENAPGTQERRALAAGSRVIIDAAEGLVVTNHHVIKDAEARGNAEMSASVLRSRPTW